MTDNLKKYSFLKSVLARRFIVYILLFSSFITLLGTSLQLYFDYSSDRNHVEQLLEQISTTHLQSIINNVWVADREQIALQLQGILTLPDMQYVEIISDNEEKISLGARKSNNIISQQYPLIYIFRGRNIRLGTLYIEATLDNIYNRLLSRVSIILLTQGVKTFLVSLFIFLIFYLLIGRHLRAMAEYTRRLDLKTMATPLSLHRPERGQNDELAQVVRSLNTMRTTMLEDIAGREESEKKIARGKAEFEAIFNAITDAIIFVDPDRCIARINPAFTELFGYTLDEVKGKESKIIYADHEKFVKQGEIRYRPDAEIKESIYEMEYRRKDGSVFPADTLGAHVLGRTGEVIGFIGIIRDIFERKQAEVEKMKLEEQLRQAYKMEAVGTMAGGIAHDFNNILAIILGNAEMARDDIPPGNPAAHSINEIVTASNRAKDLVSQILAFSRKGKKELLPVRPQSLIKETLKLLRATTPSTISIVQELSTDCPAIEADPTQLHQLLMNLFTNAVQAMDEKGVVTVRLEEMTVDRDYLDGFSFRTAVPTDVPGSYVRLSLRDTGSGIGADILKRIFDPFYTTKDVGKGTGIGLAAVHGIVESHGGFITVDSEVGKGSVFNVFFPVTDKECDSQTEDVGDLQTGSERILLIDDEEGILEMATRILESLGYNVAAQHSSVKALEMFKADPDRFDLIITDQSMPDMSGAEIADEILAIRPDMPIILCSGFSTKVSEENARGKGISKYINKPYTKKLLATAIREVLDANV